MRKVIGKPVPEVAPVEEQKVTPKGPWYRIEANALHSRNYRGVVDLGTYTEEEKKKSKLQKRIEQLQNEGYQNIQVREISSID